jgi:hypothetical protein
VPEFRGDLDHPCFFIHDAEIDLGPEDVPSTDWPTPPYIRRTDRMIAVGTIADVDGDVHICLDQEAALEGLALFDGRLSTPSGVLSITQSSGEEILRANVREETALSIGVDDLRNPRRIHVRVQN